MIRWLACRVGQLGPWLLVGAMLFLAAGTISNQIKINQANTQLRQQAENGQASLTRACKLAPAGAAIYRDAMRRGVVSAEQYALWVAATVQACPGVELPER